MDEFKLFVNMFGDSVRIGTLLCQEGELYFFGNKEIKFGNLKIADFFCKMNRSKIGYPLRSEHERFLITIDDSCFKFEFIQNQKNHIYFLFEIDDYQNFLTWIEKY